VVTSLGGYVLTGYVSSRVRKGKDKWGAVGWSWNVRVALQSSELYALDMLSLMSWRVWMLGVSAVYELPKNV